MISENVFMTKKENLNLEVNDAIEACEIEKKSNDSFNVLLAKHMNEVEKEQNQETMKLKDKAHYSNLNKMHLKNIMHLNKSKIDSLEKNVKKLTEVLEKETKTFKRQNKKVKE